MRLSVFSVVAGLPGWKVGYPLKKSPPVRRMVDRLEDIRMAMLDMLGEDGVMAHPRLVRRINRSGDAQALWHLRADLMAALAGSHGEQVAYARLNSLSVLFEGMLPKGLTSRPSALRA